jgi:hypothetical protein
MGGTDDFAAGMVGLLGSTVMLGVGVAAAGSLIRQVDRMGDQPPKQKRQRTRRAK